MSTGVKVMAFFAGLVTGALFSWSMPYGETQMWGIDHRYFMIGVTFILAIFLKLYYRNSTITLANLLACGVVVAPLLRIIVEITMDPTSHNLWPIAMAIYVLIIFPAALIGFFLSQLYLRSRKTEGKPR